MNAVCHNRLGQEICLWKRTPETACMTLQWGELSAGGYHSCGVSKEDETKTRMLKCWGLVDDGQVGWVDDTNVLLGAASTLLGSGLSSPWVMGLVTGCVASALAPLAS